MRRLASDLSCCGVLVLLFSSSLAAAPNQARITEVVRDVQVLVAQAAAHPARLNDDVRDGSAVRTGAESRAELTFADLTITRVGANSIFSFERAGRRVDVQSGAILLRVPPNSGGAKVQGNLVTVGITGTTIMFESQPRYYNKLIVLEGICHVSLKRNSASAVTVHAGQMLLVKAGASQLPDPVNIDLDRVLHSALLITKFPPLPSRDLIVAVANDQKQSGAPLANPLWDQTGMNARDVAAATQQPTPPPRKPNGR